MENLIEGLGLVDLSREDVEYVYNFNNVWYNRKSLITATKSVWTNVVDNRTKNRILDKPERWAEIPFDVQVDLAAEVLGEYQITTNGVLLKNYKDLGVRKLMVSLMNEGARTTYYISDLMYNAFIDREYDVLAQRTMIPGAFSQRQKENDITLGEIALKNKNKAEKKILSDDVSGETNTSAAIKEPTEVDELIEAYNILLGKNKEMAQHILRLEAELKEAKGTEVVKVAAADKISDVLRTQRVNGVEREIVLEGGKEYYRKGNSLILLNQEIMPRAESRTRATAQYLGFNFGG